MNLEVIITCVLSSALAAAVVTSLKDIIIWAVNRKDKQNDDEDDMRDQLSQQQGEIQHNTTELEKVTTSLVEHIQESHKLFDAIRMSNRLLMRDRIRSKAIVFIKENEISYEDRKLLHDMWHEYHESWGGNGDLNLIMDDVDKLPLKVE